MTGPTPGTARPEPPDAGTPVSEAIAFYKTVQVYEHHFNGLEFEVRKLASAWLIASFGAIAFIVRGDLAVAKSLISPDPLLILVAGLAQIGLFSLWILDQVVYHTLLDAVFTTALHLERRLVELPPLRSMMLRLTGGAGVARYLSLFYQLPMAVFAGIAWWGALHAGAAGWLAIAAAITALPVWVWIKARALAAERLRQRPQPDPNGRPAFEFVIARWQKALGEGEGI